MALPLAPPAAAARDYRIEALAKGLRVLGLFSEQRPALRLTDVAAATGIPIAGVYRIAMTLLAEGYLEQLPDGQYRPGQAVLTLGFSALAGLDLVDLATPELHRLAASSGETVNLASLSGDRVLYLVRLRSADLVTANLQVGSTLPAVHSSLGKVLLAERDDEDLCALLSPGSFPPAGPRALSLAELLPQLHRVRTQGWAVQDEEVAPGLRSVAAPVRAADGSAVAAINVAVNAREWTAARLARELRRQVVDSAAVISALLGWRPAVPRERRCT